MQKLLIDTNIWIDWINQGNHEHFLLEKGVVKYLSSIVLMELYAGAYTPKDTKQIDRLALPFQRTQRIVNPTVENYREAGRIMAKLKDRHGFQTKKTIGLSHDILIALTARSIGATVLTANRNDFETIQNLSSFSLQVV
jgi:predicted nucleic acid-binding protein